MAVRLTVVLVHPPAGNSSAQQLSEAVVGELIGLAGIDLTLIDQIAQIEPTSTDYLTLESLSGDVAVLAWQPVAETVRSLRELGFDGSRTPHADDLDAPDAEPSRRIYGYDLSEFGSPREICAAVGKLLQSRQIRTYSLESLVSKPPSSAANENAPAKKRALDSPQSTQNASESSTAKELADASDAAASSDRPTKPPLDLDSLVDQLDWFDP